MANSSDSSPADDVLPREHAAVRVLLIGNYARDGQESMQRFAAAMLEGLGRCGVDARLVRPEAFFGRLGSSSRHGLGKWLGYLDKFVVFPRRLRRELRSWMAADASTGRAATVVVHICDHSNAFYTRSLRDVSHVVTCHDLLAVRSAHGEIPENRTRWSGRIFQRIILRGLNCARHVVCVSGATERDLRRIAHLPPAQVSVIPNSLNYGYSPMPSAAATASVEEQCIRAKGSGPGSNFILHVGGNQWYKNRLGVLHIYERLVGLEKHAPSLILVGEELTPEMDAFIREKSLANRIWRLSSCSNEELRALYSAAGALIFPSLAEGFGWPVIEAQACGCPVICSRAEPFPEVAGDGAVLVEPGDVQGFAEKLRQLLVDRELRLQLIERGTANARGFQPENMISAYLQCYAALARTSGCEDLGRACPSAPLPA